MASTLDYFRNTGDVLRNDPTIEALCEAMDKAFYDPNTGIYEIWDRLLVYDFDGIADRILGGNRNLLNGLVAWYKCNDNQANTTVRDAYRIFPNTDGTSSSNTSLLSTKDGKIERGFSFDPANPDDVIIPSTMGNLDVAIDKPFSFTCQVKRDTSGSQRCIMSTAVTGTDIGILLIQTNVPSANVLLRIWQGANRWHLVSDNILTLDDYDSVTVTYDGSGLITGFNLYVRNNSGSTDSTVGTVTAFTASDFSFGVDQYGTYSPFSGDVDEIGIWDRELTASEVADIYNSGNGTTFVQTALLDYLAWGFKLYLWDRSLAPLEKLERLKSAILLKQKTGTPWAIKQAIGMVADPARTDFTTYPIVITEGTGGEFFDGSWTFDGSVYYDSDYSPFKFDVAVPFQSPPSSAEQDIIAKAINSYKNERSHLVDLTFPGWAFSGHPTLANGIDFYGKCEDNASNVIMTDSTGVGNAVLNVNSDLISTPSGLIANAFDLSGGNRYATINRLTALIDYNIPFTVSMWFYGNASSRMLFGNTFSSSVPGLGLFVGGAGKLLAFASTSAGNFVQITNNESLSSGWNYATLSYDGNGITNGFATGADLKLNDVSNNTISIGGSQMSFTPSAVYIGRVSTSYDPGTVDEVGFWSRVLTTAEKTALYNSGAGLTY